MRQNCNGIVAIVLLLVVISFGVAYIIFNMPTRVCHDVTNTQKWSGSDWTDVPLFAKVVCTNPDIVIRDYWILGIKEIYGCDHFESGTTICPGGDGYCLIQTTTQVCELK